jgi:hypothetical protein
LLFGYSNNNAETVIGTDMSGPAANTETIILRRIILEKGNAFTYNGQDNNRLFFCGQVTTTAPVASINKGDFIFGYLTTNPLTI